MKYLYLIVFTLTFLFCKTNSDNYHQDRINNADLTNNIIGVWEFVHTTDILGNKLDSIKMRFGTMKAAGPKLIYHGNKEFIKIFTPVNSDKGYWRYNPETSSIEHDLYIDSTDWTGKSVISNNLAVKKSDGNYYELGEVKILKFQEDTMWIENRGLIDVFKKVDQ